MDVSAALKLKSLQNASVLAGRNGVKRKIKAAEVMEVPDIGGWLTEGIVIISTFYSIKDSPEAQIKMFKTLIKVNGGALFIKLGRYVNDLPHEMYDLANKHDMPIIAIPVDVSYVNVLNALFEKIYEEKRSHRHEQLQLMNKLINTEVNSLKDFMKELSSISGENVYYETADNRLLVYAKKEKDRRRKNFSILSKPAGRENIYQVHGLNKDPLAKDDRMVITVQENEVCEGYLHIILRKSQDLLGVLESCKVGIKEQIKFLLLKEKYEIENRYLQEAKFLKYLIEKKNEINPGYVENYINPGKNQMYGIFAFDFSVIKKVLKISSNKDQVIIYGLYKKIYEVFDEQLPGTYLFKEDSYFYGMYMCENQQDRSLLITKLEKTFKQLEREFVSDIYCGLSLAYNSIENLYKAVDEAKASLQTRHEMNLNYKIILYEKMGINKILLKLKNDSNVLHFIQVILESLKSDDNGEELIHTLDVFLQENGNHSKTSEKLFVHRRTLKYRLTKIESILNVNLDDSETRFLLFFLIKMRKFNLK